jgi:hypothetical protein
MIQCQVGPATDICVKEGSIVLNANSALSTFSLASDSSCFKFGEARILLNKKDNKDSIQLMNKASSIIINNDKINIKVGTNTNIIAQDGRITIDKGVSCFRGNVAAEKSLFVNGNTYIGHVLTRGLIKSVEGALCLCKSDGKYLRVLGEELEQLYE